MINLVVTSTVPRDDMKTVFKINKTTDAWKLANKFGEMGQWDVL